MPAEQYTALTAALDAYVGARIDREREEWKQSGIREAYHALLDEALRLIREDEQEGHVHYERFKPALAHLRATWPEMFPKRS